MCACRERPPCRSPDAAGIGKFLPPPQGEVAERSEVGGGAALYEGTLPQSANADSPL